MFCIQQQVATFCDSVEQRLSLCVVSSPLLPSVPSVPFIILLPILKLKTDSVNQLPYLTIQAHGSGNGKSGNGETDNCYDDSALSAYDPYGRHNHIYKGVRLTEDTDHKEYVSFVFARMRIYF